MKTRLSLSRSLIVPLLAALPALHTAQAKHPTTVPAATSQPGVGEKVPSDDDLIPNLHCMGLLEGRTDIFRCACPIREIAKQVTGDQPTLEETAEANARMKRLYDLGVRTVVSFQNPDDKHDEKPENHTAVAISMEKQAAQTVGLRYVSDPINNSGPDSIESMTDAQLMQWLDSTSQQILDLSKTGGVAFHCTAGHDRSGIVAAYIRMKYQHWPVEEAIAEMRRYGHNWPKFSHNGGVSSWHEDHLRAIAKMLLADQSQPMTRTDAADGK